VKENSCNHSVQLGRDGRVVTGYVPKHLGSDPCGMKINLQVMMGSDAVGKLYLL